MKEDLEERLFSRFPSFFRYRSNLRASLMGFGFECGDGWFDLIWKLCEDIERAVPPEGFNVAQVKEKYGGLRFYAGPCSEEVFNLISEAEDKSYSICEICGAPGKLRDDRGWILTLCDKHNDNDKSKLELVEEW